MRVSVPLSAAVGLSSAWSGGGGLIRFTVTRREEKGEERGGGGEEEGRRERQQTTPETKVRAGRKKKWRGYIIWTKGRRGFPSHVVLPDLVMQKGRRGSILN